MIEIDKLLHKIIKSQKYENRLNNIYSSNKNIFPNRNDVFRAFKLCPLSKTKVVIFGQDPYYTKGVADGLAFSTRSNKTPASLKNIFKEIKLEYPNSLFSSNNLESWANQGVLLLNTSLTVEENLPLKNSLLWMDFIREILNLINNHCNNIIFVLWGNQAIKLKKYISKNHYILESSHPSPLSANKGFIGNNHFKKINEILKSLNLDTINWNT
ncbi:MAG: uracil-DNA glycosylase [Mycoplasma sp.]|nr:uracil-DNA glycosylase [Mycoplasma sp.]